ncbi:MAG: flagellar assembly protein T N-terminal domain-containing protein [Nitrospirae bacterium]|nr:flagellar assembly protein T N-terminal domain-containing protein [Nitrospirota bacterium]
MAKLQLRTILLKRVIFCAVLMSCIFIPSGLLYASKAEYVEAEGYAVISGDRKDIARESALNNAFRRAVEQAIGVLVESETMVRNFELLNDRVYSKSAGYVKKYSITGEKIEGDTFRIRINAMVSKVRLEKDLDEIGLLIKKAGKPRLMLLISEQNIAADKPSYWWGSGSSVSMGVAENTLMEKFMGKGFNFVDRQVVLAGMKEEIKAPVSSASALSNETALKLASMGEAEVVIIGQAVAKAGPMLMNTSIRSCQATVSVRVLNADSGEPLATSSASATVAHVDPITGGSEALKKASAEISDKLISQILAKWKKRVSGAHAIKLSVSGVKFDSMKAFREFLKDKIENVEEIYDRSYKDGIARMDVEISGSTKEMAEELSGKKFNNGLLEVMSFTSNVIELKLKPRY